MVKLSNVLTVTGVTLGVAALGYAVYFDYRRRTDPTFRKLLKKQSKQSQKAAKREQKAAEQEETAQLETAVKEVAQPGVLPATPQEKEAYFMEQVATGEALFAQGAAFHVPAAVAFFKALKVYPAPVELVMIYQKAVPKEVFDLIMKLIARDAAVNGSGDAAGAASAASAAAGAANLDEVDDEAPGAAGKPAAKEENTPSNSTSQEWEKVSPPQAPADSGKRPGQAPAAQPPASAEDDHRTAAAAAAEAEKAGADPDAVAASFSAVAADAVRQDTGA